MPESGRGSARVQEDMDRKDPTWGTQPCGEAAR
jgi:hypothetical protein